MWILTSLSRPERIRALVDSYAWGDESQVYLTLYEKDPLIDRYLDQKWPASWMIELVSMLGNGPTYNEMLRRYPHEQTYGFLADDAVLETPGMLWRLERAAGDWAVAYPNDGVWKDGGLATMPCIGGELVRAAGDWAVAYPNDGVWKDGGLATMPCIGGELVRAAGYLSPPNFVHMSIDSVWTVIAQRLGTEKYMPELRYTHNHPLVGRAAWDDTYMKAQLMSVGHEQALHSFISGSGLQGVVQRVGEKRAG